MHKKSRLLDCWSEEAEQRHGWLHYQHQMAEEFLALGLEPRSILIIRLYYYSLLDLIIKHVSSIYKLESAIFISI